jgi:hypothetical protein
MTTVFISYRREIIAGEARALFNELLGKLGKNSVFMDVDSIALGRDFRRPRDQLQGGGSCNAPGFSGWQGRIGLRMVGTI